MGLCIDDSKGNSKLSVAGGVRLQERWCRHRRLLHLVTIPSLSWCNPCKLIAPYIENYKNEYSIALAKIDTEKSDELCSRFNVHAVPSYILLKKSGGDVVEIGLVVSAHPGKLRKLFEAGVEVKVNKT